MFVSAATTFVLATAAFASVAATFAAAAPTLLPAAAAFAPPAARVPERCAALAASPRAARAEGGWDGCLLAGCVHFEM